MRSATPELHQGICHVLPERYRDVPEDSGTADIMIQEVDRLTGSSPSSWSSPVP